MAQLSDAPNRTISDAGNTQTLPGAIVRGEDDEPVADASVNEAFDGLGATFEMLLAVFGRNSLNDAGAPLEATVHYGVDYDNAFWDGERMVFGDGDGEVFVGFTSSTTVIGHELAHGVVQYTANLEYQGQPGALNESIADVFGALTEQYLLGQAAADATWLIGAEIFTDAVQGSALRSMLKPGTAYDDDELGKDPQPDHMSGFCAHDRRQRRCAHQLRHPEPRLRTVRDRPRWQRLGDRRHGLVPDADRRALEHRELHRVRRCDGRCGIGDRRCHRRSRSTCVDDRGSLWR